MEKGCLRLRAITNNTGTKLRGCVGRPLSLVENHNNNTDAITQKRVGKYKQRKGELKW